MTAPCPGWVSWTSYLTELLFAHGSLANLPRVSGLTCLAIARDDGPATTKTVMTGVRERVVNMHAFTAEALNLLEETLKQIKGSTSNGSKL